MIGGMDQMRISHGGMDHIKKNPTLALLVAVVGSVLGIAAAVRVGLYVRDTYDPLAFILYAVFGWQFVAFATAMVCAFVIVLGAMALGGRQQDRDEGEGV